MRRTDPSSGRSYDGTIVRWTPNGETSTGEKEPWWKVQDDVDPAHPFDTCMSDLDEAEVLAALKAWKDVNATQDGAGGNLQRGHVEEQQQRQLLPPPPSLPLPLPPPLPPPLLLMQPPRPPPQHDWQPEAQQASLLRLLRQRRGQAPIETPLPAGDKGGKRRRVAPAAADAASLLLRTADFPVGQSAVPLRRMDFDEETGASTEYIDWCTVVGHCGNALKLQIPNASACDKSLVSLLEVQLLVEKCSQERRAQKNTAAHTSSELQHDAEEKTTVATLRAGPDQEEAAFHDALNSVAQDAEEQCKSGAVESLPGANAHAGPDDCVVCCDGARSHFFVPCGHHCVCKGCSQKVIVDSGLCPVCRTQIVRAMPIFQP